MTAPLAVASSPRELESGLRFGKYLAIAGTAFRQRLLERAALVGRIMFYFVILLIFSRLWQAVFAAEASGLTGGNEAGGRVWADYVWYLAVTEWIMLSQPLLYLDIEADVRSGDIAYHLARPMSYVGGKLAEGMGDMALRMLVLGMVGLGFGRLFSGEWPSIEGLGLAVGIGLLASVLLMLSYAAVGLCAFWIHDCTPVYLIWQKLTFVLGGLMLPLSIYPEWLRVIALHSPFAAMLYGPGQLVMQPSTTLALSLALRLVMWGFIFALLVVALERRGRRIITVHGG